MNDIPADIRDQIEHSLVGSERQVLELRLGIGIPQPKTLTQIGEALGLSREKVRQLQASALSNLASPMINAILLVDEIKSPNSGSAKKMEKTDPGEG